VAVFSESHLERCINMCSFANGGTESANTAAGYSASTNALLNQVRTLYAWIVYILNYLPQSVSLFFEELVAITTVSNDPQILYKIVSMWNRVASINSVRDILVSQPSIGLPIASHLLQCCLTQVSYRQCYQFIGSLLYLFSSWRQTPTSWTIWMRWQRIWRPSPLWTSTWRRYSAICPRLCNLRQLVRENLPAATHRARLRQYWVQKKGVHHRNQSERYWS